MTEKNFPEWLQTELDARGWRPIDLIKRSGIDSGLLSKIQSGERRPGLDTCRSIARAFGMRDVDILRVAGLIDDAVTDEVIRLSEEDATIGDVYRIMKTMTREQRFQALTFLRFVKEQGSTYEADK